jgi:hypothetical protein
VGRYYLAAGHRKKLIFGFRLDRGCTLLGCVAVLYVLSFSVAHRTKGLLADSHYRLGGVPFLFLKIGPMYVLSMLVRHRLDSSPTFFHHFPGYELVRR